MDMMMMDVFKYGHYGDDYRIYHQDCQDIVQVMLISISTD